MQSIDDFSNQLASGFRLLHFTDKLELAYIDNLRAEQRMPTLICGCFTLLIWISFAILDLHRITTAKLWEDIDLLVYLWLAVRWISLILIATSICVAALSKTIEYENYSLSSYLSISIAAPITADITRYYDAFSADSAQIIVVMAAFLPLGFRFYTALRAALFAAAIAILLIAFGGYQRDSNDRLQLSAMLLLAVPVAAIGGYLREYSDRRQFLLSGILNREAMTDALTELPNRRGLALHATSIIRRARKNKANITVAIVDVDYFKQFNDISGHPEGDLVLRQVADALAQTVRQPLDIVARIGGEEFCVLLYGATDARNLLEHALANIKNLSIAHPRSPHGMVTVSIGATTMVPNENLQTAMARADTALYKAKDKGRAIIEWA